MVTALSTRSVPRPTLDAGELRAALGDPDAAPVVLDVRWHLGGPSGEEDFDAGHIPGAVFVDLDADLAGRPGPAGRHPLPDPDDLEETLRRVGVGRRSSVVVYDGGDAMAAARAWWVLRWAGLPADRVRVLDGGWPAWIAGGGEQSTTGGGRPMGDVAVAAGAMPVLVADTAAALGERGALLDARAPQRFAGENEPVDPVAGHVPGARNVPASRLLGPDGRYRPPGELAELLGPYTEGPAPGAAGVAGPAVGAYCGSGVSATMLVLAAELAGLRGPDTPVALYVGSWSHWCAARRPVETGADPGTGTG